MSERNKPLDDISPPEKYPNTAIRGWLLVPLIIAFGIILVGAFFKILHWEGADLLLMIGLIGFPAVVIFRFILKCKKALFDYVLAFFLIIWPASALFAIFRWEGANQLLQLGGIAFLGVLIVGAFHIIDKFRKGVISFGYIVGLLATGFIVVGAIFKVLHWAYSEFLLTTGVLVLILWIILSFRNPGANQ